LVGLHWIYLLFIVLIIGCMVFRKDTTLVCVAGIFLIGLVATGSFASSVSGVFNSFIYAIKELLGTILVILLIVAMSSVLTKTGINELMIAPFTRLIRTPGLAFWIIGILMMVISWFFWPSPAVALIGAVLLPVALRVGLPALGVAMAMNLFGHEIALSGDYIIQGAPKLTSAAAGIPIGDVISASIPLVAVMGVVTTATAFWFLRRDMKRGKLKMDSSMATISPLSRNSESYGLSLLTRRIMAFIVPLLFIADVVAMVKLHLQGGDATALIGGTCVFIMGLVSLLAHKKTGLEKATGYLLEGFQFGFKSVRACHSDRCFRHFPCWLDRSPVLRRTRHRYRYADGSRPNLCHLGWRRHAHPWALIPAAAVTGVDPIELARRNLKPVVIGLVVTTIVAMFLI
jgi:hypothetical protein